MPRKLLDEEVLEQVSGGNFARTDADNDGAGTLWVYYRINGQDVPQTGALKYDDYSKVTAFINSHYSTMSDVEMFDAMAKAGILHE